MLRLIKPSYFMPFHGEYRMLKHHADLAVLCGMPKENTFVLSNGDVLALKDGKVSKAGHITADDIYVDGNRIGDVSNAVMRDRKIMANDGIVVVIANINSKDGKLITLPNVIARGFVQVNENMDLLKKLEYISKEAINKTIKTGINYTEIKNEIISSLSNYISNQTGRKPIILPVIMNVKDKVNNS